MKTADPASRCWQLTFNNPLEHGWSHEQIKEVLAGFPTITYWCMSDEKGLDKETPHTHLYINLSPSNCRFSTLKNKFPTAHLEKAMGTPKQNRDYVAKEGKWKTNPKGETSIPGTYEEWGELPEEPAQSARSDLQEIGDLVERGLTPTEIMAINFSYRRYERLIRSAFFEKRKRETPPIREVKIHYLVGEAGSGKSFTYVKLCEEQDEENVFLVTDYDGGGWDIYCGEPILFMDEYKGQLPFSTLLTLTDVYKAQIHARYSNVVALWQEVYITSVFPPEELYQKMVAEDLRGRDKQQQLLRRITDITYCWKNSRSEYRRHTIPMTEYTNYDELREKAKMPEWVREAERAEQMEMLP